MSEGIIIFIRRFAEIIFTNFIISGFITLLNKMEILVERGHIISVLLIGAVIFFIVNIRMFRNCYFDMGKFHKEYYIINTGAYLLFAIICTAVYFLGTGEVYTWLFSITKLIRYTVNEIDTHYSALFFHFIGLATVFLSPIGIKYVEYEVED